MPGSKHCCVFTPDEPANVSSLFHHMRTEVSDITPQPRGLNKSVVRITGLLVKKKKLFPILRIIILLCVCAIVAVASASNAARQRQTSHLRAHKTRC